jgi:hypothetical protein
MRFVQKILAKKDKHEPVGDAQKSLVIFLHIPKCAGTTLVEEVLRRRFPPERLLIHYNAGTGELLERLRTMNEREKRLLECIAGHFAFGIHELLPQPCTYITLLRNPVERVISHFEYVKRQKSHYLHALASAEGTSLLDYVSSLQNTEVKNGQAQLLAGIGWGVHSGKTEKEILDRAKKNLENHFALAGVMEQFDAFIYLIWRILGWDVCGYEKKNVTRTTASLTAIPDETLRAIAAYNRLDQQLYDQVKLSFNKKLEIYDR